MSEQSTIPRKRVTSLDDLPSAGDTIWIEFTAEGGIYEIETRRLSHADWMQIDFDLPHESPPQRVGKRGVEYNYEDVDYLKRVGQRQQTLALRRIAASLTMPIAGNDLEQKARTISTTKPVGFVNALYGALSALHGEGEADVVERVFHKATAAPDVGVKDAGD